MLSYKIKPQCIQESETNNLPETIAIPSPFAPSEKSSQKNKGQYIISLEAFKWYKI